MNRRDFLKGLTVSTVAGLLIPERRFWSLDRTMVTPPALLSGYMSPGYTIHFPPGDFLIGDGIIIPAGSRYGLGFVDTMGRVSVTDFGADPTGTRDSTASIQAAIDYAAGMRG